MEEQLKEEYLLVEYRMAQSSAEHHDGLVWHIVSVVWGGSLILMGFVISNLLNHSLRIPIIIVSFLGIVLTIFTWYHAWLLTTVKIQKYNRCKYIEGLLGLKQHSDLKYPKRVGFVFFTFIMICFILVWILIIFILIL